MLETLLALLGATVVTVPIARRLGVGSIVGYLIAGLAIGPNGLRLVTGVPEIQNVSELGVIMLLFLIGLEIRPHRLWILRRTILGLGFGQMVPSAAILAILAHLCGIGWSQSCLLGLGLALSSTAIVLPMLNERGLLSTAAGRDSFAVLLFQDMAFVPLVALLPLFVPGHITNHLLTWSLATGLAVHLPWLAVGRGVLAVAVILIGGIFLVEKIFGLIGGARIPEVFTAMTLLIVVGTTSLAHWAGLSPSLGAFMAGALLSDSEYRHAIQADIEPFEGLLLGFFFISVGMSVDFPLLLHAPGTVVAGVAALLVVKFLVALAVDYVKRRNFAGALRFAAALPEGSEFSFVLFGAAVAQGVMARHLSDLATLVIALSMLFTPILFTGLDYLATSFLTPGKKLSLPLETDDQSKVIICGFGRVGQIIGRVLSVQRVRFTALDQDASHIAFVRRFGARAYFGDPTRLSVLRAAGAETAKVLVIALDKAEATVKLAEMARRRFPHLTIVARARNRRHAQLLMDVGAHHVVRETLLSSLKLGEMALEAVGVPHDDAERTITAFQASDERLLAETRSFAGDESRIMTTLQQNISELQELFEADQKSR